MRRNLPVPCHHTGSVESLNQFNVMVVGVGGQGNLLLSQLIASAARSEGFDVQTGETLGMAQRGGPVMSFVRYGKKVYTPIIPDREAHTLIAIEPAEALRSIRYVGQQTSVLLNTNEKRPLGVLLGEAKYPDLKTILTTLSSTGAKTFTLNARELAERVGNTKTANVCLLGGMAALGNSQIQVESFRSALKETLPERVLQVNMQAFQLGYETIVGSVN